jgi:uncharacterized protein (TIGR02145 family)
MNTIKAIFAGLLAASVSMAAISGIVIKDTVGTIIPIAGAVEQGGQTATTGTDGSFTLTGTGVIDLNNNKLSSNKLSASTGNGVLYLHLQERGAVELQTYTLHGQAVSRVYRMLDKGTHRIAQSHNGNGVYLYRIKACGIELIVKSPTLGRIAGGAVSSTQGTSTTATAGSAERYIPIADVIRVMKEGYLNCRIAVNNSDTSNIVIKIISQDAGTVTDIDGNVYRAIRIGSQVWTAENLRTTKYNDGTPVTLDTSTATWTNATTEKYCYYSNTTNADSIKKYGALYNWYVVAPTNPKKIAPAGWHVPTDAEWDTLENHLIANGYNWDGTTTVNKSMAAKTDWISYAGSGAIGNNLTKNNTSGFSALPGGHRIMGYFSLQTSDGYWWSATESVTSKAWLRYLYSGLVGLGRYDISKSSGFSVRLVRDVE